jgi:hypothetical protein
VDAPALRRYYADLDAGDFEGAAACFAEDAVYIRPAMPTPGSAERPLEFVRGRDSVLDFFRARGKRAHHHEIRALAVNGRECGLEGVVLGGDGPPQVFLASATLDDDGLIARYVALAMPVTADELDVVEKTR